MSDLRQRMVEALVPFRNGKRTYTQTNDAILAAIADALTSDAALDAAEDGMYVTISSGPGTRPLIYEEDVPSARAAITAALTAAGVTTGEGA